MSTATLPRQPARRTLQEMSNVSNPVSLSLKKEAIRKGRLTSSLKIWLDPATLDEKKIAATRRGHIRFYDRKMAEFAARDARRSLLLKQRDNARRLNPTVLRLLRHRDQRARKEGVGAKKKVEFAEPDTEWVEMKRVRDASVAHLISLRRARAQRSK
ncbi:hypothetical protein C8R44DRAFT_892196 [Mycena epipterygia]|nr:hypothetical protein C8R44DRAFT_892196 [Mycena epipterygia]